MNGDILEELVAAISLPYEKLPFGELCVLEDVRRDYFQLKAGIACHSMLITGVNIGEDGKPNRWKLENTYDVEGLHKGYFTCSDSWFDKYMVSLMLCKRYLRKYEDAMEGEPNSFRIWEIM